MSEKRKVRNVVGDFPTNFEQSTYGGQLIGGLRTIIVLLAFGGLAVFYTSSRPIEERVATQFNIEIPASASDFQIFSEHYDGIFNIARFTVPDEGDAYFAIINGINDNKYLTCLIDNLDYSYMPPFTNSSRLDWWQPLSATEYEGAHCWREYDNGGESHDLLLLDFSVKGQITVYIQDYTVSAEGYRTPFE